MLQAWQSPVHMPTLPATKMSVSGGTPIVCAAYRAQCVRTSYPPRAMLSLASGVGGVGLGVPASGGGWHLRNGDFCKGPPRELRYQQSRREKTAAPKPEHCFCPTASLEARKTDPLGFGRSVPIGGLPQIPRPIGTAWPGACAAGRSFVTYQCSRHLLVPSDPSASAEPSTAGASSLAKHKSPGAVAWSRATQLLRATTLPPMSIGAAADPRSRSAHATRGGVHVLLATSDHFGHGVFALVQRVLNQVYLARSLHMQPAVFLGERTFMELQACEYGSNPYFDESAGDNVWEYWFEQPGNFSLGSSHALGQRIASIQVTTVEAVAEHPIRSYAHDPRQRLRSRTNAHRLLGDGGQLLVKQFIRDEAARSFAPWRQRSRHIIGVHLRGTDKVVRAKVPPEAYFPFLDAYLTAHDDALIFVATDDRKYARRLGARYGIDSAVASRGTADGGDGGDEHPNGRAARFAFGRPRIVSRGLGYLDASWGGRADPARPRNLPLHRSRGGGVQKGLEVLVDALLLSKCDYVLMSTSGVAEFALWIAPHLWTHHLDLQATDRLKSQALPPWTRHVPGVANAIARGVPKKRAVGDAFCLALELGCSNETALATHRRSLYGGRYCSKCARAVDAV